MLPAPWMNRTGWLSTACPHLAESRWLSILGPVSAKDDRSSATAAGPASRLGQRCSRVDDADHSGQSHCGVKAGRGSNPSATIETTMSIMATSGDRPVSDGAVVSTTGDGLLGPPTTAI